jgi:metal-responsive CopG/Arc/MetJ family transcriptional regulator
MRHTKFVKTTISIPDGVFEQAERLARQSRKSRSKLFSDAMREYVARHASDDVTDATNRVCAQVGDTENQFLSRGPPDP